MSIFKEPTFWFALISASCAAYTVLNNLYSRCKSLSIHLNWISYYGGQLNASFNFYNPSSENRSVTNIEILYDNNHFPVTIYPDILGTRKPDSVSPINAFSDEIPVNISPKSSVSVIVPFKHLPSGITDVKSLDFIFNVDNKANVRNVLINGKLIDPEQLVRRLNRRFQ